jgi:chromosomal replication initiation ATPase DnaA
MNTREQAIDLVKAVCDHYKITHNQMTAMSKTNHFKICKNSDNELVRLAEIRMALSYFLYMHCPLRLTEIAPLVGYKDHSTMSIYRKRIEFYIQTEDQKFFPYYLKVIDIASDLGISMKLKRILSYTNIAFIDHCGKVHLELSN